MSRAACTVEGCGRPVEGRGLCNCHYVRWIRNERRWPPCSEPGCCRGAYARGLCWNAYMRWWRRARAGDGGRPGQSSNEVAKEAARA